MIDFRKNLYYSTGLGVNILDHYPCNDNPEICANDYCRCREINGAEFYDSVTLSDIYLALDNPKLNSIDRYCLDRYIASWKAVPSLDVQKDGGYYGEELRGVYFLQADMYQKWFDTNIWKQTDCVLKLRTVLALEYSNSDHLSDVKSASIEDIDIDKINFSNTNHLRKINVSKDEYSIDRVAYGIVLEHANGRYDLIDGYHRISSYKDSHSNLQIPMVVLRK